MPQPRAARGMCAAAWAEQVQDCGTPASNTNDLVKRPVRTRQRRPPQVLVPAVGALTCTKKGQRQICKGKLLFSNRAEVFPKSQKRKKNLLCVLNEKSMCEMQCLQESFVIVGFCYRDLRLVVLSPHKPQTGLFDLIFFNVFNLLCTF